MSRILTVILGAFLGAAAGIAAPDTMREIIFCVICSASFILGVIADIMGDGVVMTIRAMKKSINKKSKELQKQYEVIVKKKEIDEKILLRLDEITEKLEIPFNLNSDDMEFLLTMGDFKKKYEEVKKGEKSSI